jgi:anti-anti-sigma regulatory factor
MNKQGQMKLIGVSDDIKEIFDITGFSEILSFE